VASRSLALLSASTHWQVASAKTSVAQDPPPQLARRCAESKRRLLRLRTYARRSHLQYGTPTKFSPVLPQQEQAASTLAASAPHRGRCVHRYGRASTPSGAPLLPGRRAPAPGLFAARFPAPIHRSTRSLACSHTHTSTETSCRTSPCLQHAPLSMKTWHRRRLSSQSTSKRLWGHKPVSPARQPTDASAATAAATTAAAVAATVPIVLIRGAICRLDALHDSLLVVSIVIQPTLKVITKDLQRLTE